VEANKVVETNKVVAAVPTFSPPVGGICDGRPEVAPEFR